MPAPTNYDNDGLELSDNKKLFIANLGYQTTAAGLLSFFSQFGEVQHCKVVLDKCGSSRGFGFVWMRDPEVCAKINGLANPEDPLEQSGFTIDGRSRVHCSFHNSAARKGGPNTNGGRPELQSSELQGLQEAKAMAQIAAQAAHAQLNGGSIPQQQHNLMQQQQQQQQQLNSNHNSNHNHNPLHNPYHHSAQPLPVQPPPPPPPYMQPPPSFAQSSQILPSMPSALAAANTANGPAVPGNVPKQFKCEIDGEIMEDPVVAADGWSYERCNIRRWLKTKIVSPKTQHVLEHTTLLPNHSLKELIETWREDQRAVPAPIPAPPLAAATPAISLPGGGPSPSSVVSGNVNPHIAGVEVDSEGNFLSAAEVKAKRRVMQLLGPDAFNGVAMKSTRTALDEGEDEVGRKGRRGGGPNEHNRREYRTFLSARRVLSFLLSFFFLPFSSTDNNRM